MCALYDGFTEHLCVSGIAVDVTVKSVLIYEVDMLTTPFWLCASVCCSSCKLMIDYVLVQAMYTTMITLISQVNNCMYACCLQPLSSLLLRCPRHQWWVSSSLASCMFCRYPRQFGIPVTEGPRVSEWSQIHSNPEQIDTTTYTF